MASTTGSTKPTAGWWTINVLEQNNEDPKERGQSTSLQSTFWNLNVPSSSSASSLCPEIFTSFVSFIIYFSCQFYIQSSLQYCRCLFVFQFSHTIAKKCWLKKPTAVKWSRLTLVSLKWCFAERGSLIFVPPQAPRFTVMWLTVAKRTFCVLAYKKSKTPPISGRRRCVFISWWMSLEYRNRTSSWLTVTNGGAIPFILTLTASTVGTNQSI